MKSLWSKINSPLPGWLTLILLCGVLTAHAALPSFSASWITANAAATPSPAVTGFYGEALVAQATAAAASTPQPGNPHAAGTITADTGMNTGGTFTSTKNTGLVLLDNSATTGNNFIGFTNTSGTLIIGVENSSGSSLLVGAPAYATALGTSANEPLVFGTSNNVRMTIAGNGNVSMPNLATTSTNQNGYVCFTTGGAITVDSTTCLASSIRYKRDVQPITQDTALKEVLALKPVTFYYKPTGRKSFDTERNHAAQQMGFIAEQAEKVDPKLIGYDTYGKPQSFRYENFTAMLAGAIQAQQREIDSKGASNVVVLDPRIDALESQVRALWTALGVVVCWCLVLTFWKRRAS